MKSVDMTGNESGPAGVGPGHASAARFPGDSVSDDQFDPSESEFFDEQLVERGTQTGSPLEHEHALRAQARDEESAQIMATQRELDTGDGVYWRITRIGQQDPDMNGYCETWPDARVTLENIKNEFGGGTYRCKGFRSDGGYGGHKTFRIAGDAVRKPKKQLMQESAGTDSGGFNVQSFLAQQRQDDERRRREQDERDERRRKERLELISTIGPIVAPIVAAMMGNRGPDLGSLLAAVKPPDPLQQIAALKALMPEPAPSPPSALDSAIVLLEKFKDMGALGGDQGTGWMDILKEAVKFAGPGLAGAVETVVQNAQTASLERQRAAQINGGAGVSAADETAAAVLPALAPPPSEGSNMLGLLKHIPFLRGQLNRWVIGAGKHVAPSLYAQMFFVDAPEDLDAHELMGLLSRPDWFQQLCKLDNRCAQFPDWFLGLHAVLTETLQTEYLGQPSTGGVGAAGPLPQSVTASGQVLAGASTSSVVRPPPSNVGPDGVDRPRGIPSLTGN